jgi:hypothetical protein
LTPVQQRLSKLAVLHVYGKVKIKVTFTLEQAMKAERGVEDSFTFSLTLVPDGGVYFFFNLGTRWGWEVNATPYPQE